MADNVGTTAQFLRSKGLTPAQIAGIIGVMQGESGKGLSTTATNPTSGAYGIAQWLGGRKSALLSNPNPSSIHTQLNHLWSELQGPERGALGKIKGAHTVDDAVKAWLFAFERPGPGEANLPGRTANARAVLNSLGRTVGRQPAAGGPAGASQAVPGTDNSALRAQAVQDFLGSKNADPVTFAMAIRGAQDVPGQTTTTAPAAGSSAPATSAPAGHGVVSFEGKQVAGWIAPALAYARAHGWKGQVNSGYRSYAEQTQIYNSGVRPAAKPGTSNHEGTDFPRGAVDVSDAATLSAILKRSKFAGQLQWAGSKDPVHFSHPHGGSY